MRFVHIADMHFDSPFSSLKRVDGLGEKRRLEQREVFKKIINYIKENHIEAFFIVGDLYEHEYVRQSTIEYINNLFREIPNTKIYIAPGNHDPMIKKSYYSKFKWNDNVSIFGPKIERIVGEDVDIYGYGFDDFYKTNSGVEEIEIQDKNKANILLVHGSVDSSKLEDRSYNPMSKTKLERLGFSYIALGHIHKSNFKEQEKPSIIYPGSPISFGFDELGEHGMIVGEVTKEKLDIHFIPLDKREFRVLECNISEVKTKEELIQYINEIEGEQNDLYEVILTGKRNFEINLYEIYKLIPKENILKLKDKTIPNFDIQELAKQNNLKGIFIKNMLEKLKQNPEEKEWIEKAIEIGLEALRNEIR